MIAVNINLPVHFIAEIHYANESASADEKLVSKMLILKQMKQGP